MITLKIGSIPHIRLSLGNVVIVRTGADPYIGAYTVDPKFYEQTLETASKIMRDDVTVHAIEVQRVSNPAGGRTVYIGGVING